MSEITAEKLNNVGTERKSFMESVKAYFEYVYRWYSNLNERTGYRFTLF